MPSLRETAGGVPAVGNPYASRFAEQTQGAAKPLRGKFPFDCNLLAKAAGHFKSRVTYHRRGGALVFSMSDCPKYQSCNAPVCPIDLAEAHRFNHKEDPTCFYLSESVKHGSQASFQGAGLGGLYKFIHWVTPAIATRHPRIKRALERAQQTGSRMARLVNKCAGGGT